jgi:hypothetical protein
MSQPTVVSTFASPHEPTLKPKACKRAFANARTERQCSKNEMKLTEKMNNETLIE